MLGNATVTVVSTTTDTDPDGNKTTVQTRTDVPGCAFAPRSSNERADARTPAVITGGTVYMPAGSVLDADDGIEVDGVLYAVEGDPGKWVSPFTGRDFGLEVAVKKWSA